jgi:hypothetical protein
MGLLTLGLLTSSMLAAERTDKGAMLLVWETRKGRELYSLRREGYLRSPLGLSADGRKGSNCSARANMLFLWDALFSC